MTLKIEQEEKFDKDTFLKVLESIENYEYYNFDIEDDEDDNGFKYLEEEYCIYLNYKIYEVESYGGEGQGEQAWSVYKVVAPDESFQHVKCDYSYYSHYGNSFSGAEYYETEEKEVVVTQWVKV